MQEVAAELPITGERYFHADIVVNGLKLSLADQRAGDHCLVRMPSGLVKDQGWRAIERSATRSRQLTARVLRALFTTGRT